VPTADIRLQHSNSPEAKPLRAIDSEKKRSALTNQLDFITGRGEGNELVGPRLNKRCGATTAGAYL
jgi:hypothetical protein